MPIEKRWVIKPQGDPQKVDELATATGIPRCLLTYSYKGA